MYYNKYEFYTWKWQKIHFIINECSVNVDIFSTFSAVYSSFFKLCFQNYWRVKKADISEIP